MTRWAGKIGISEQTEVTPGIWEDVITEHDALGTVKQRTEVLDSEGSVLPRYRTTTSISVPYRGPSPSQPGLVYITLNGFHYKPSTVVVEPPNIVIYIGEEYHGPFPS